MSKTSAVVAVIMGAVIICLCLWVKSLRSDVTFKDGQIAEQLKAIEERDKANKALSDANVTLTAQVQTERQAAADRAQKIKELEDKLKGKEGKYENATKNDACANTRAPDDVLSVMQ